ncbi:hypothetical protein LX59_03010 [Azomonas agilis]|uniref:Uncharacterized protein n=1 Tax=Azomonas agilis TaxID=116849 RepID=A0A562HZ18_9GAMM|nr:hypothetical protein [Azomonas agilis]TWH63846.1 hypothetical protein LX59_03010 [Azomonas agilis]
MSSPQLDKAFAAAEEVRKGIAELKNQRAQVQHRKERLLAEQETLFTQPLTREDLKSLIGLYVDKRADLFIPLSGLKEKFAVMANPSRHHSMDKKRGAGCHLRDLDKYPTMSLEDERTFFGRYGFELTSFEQFKTTGIAECYFFGDQIKAKLEQAFDLLFKEYPAEDQNNIGPSVAERRKRLAIIAQELAGVDTELCSIGKQLQTLGYVESTPVPTPPRQLMRF